MVHRAESLKSNACVGNFERLSVITGDVSRKKLSKTKLLSEMQIARDPGIWRFAFDKNLIHDIKFEKFRMGEDQSFLAEALLRCKSLHVSENYVYQYLVGSGLQLTHQQNAVKEVWDFIAFCEKQKLMKLTSRFHVFIYTKQVISLSLVRHELGIATAFSKIISFSGLRIGYALLFLFFLLFTVFENLWSRVKND
jgi:hypothetical protein